MQKQLLEKYVNAVMAAPHSLGLTAAKDHAEFWERHVLDALKVLSLLPPALHEHPLRLIDIGSGNGVPGIPVAIAVPKWQVFLLDSNSKKIGFIDTFCKSNRLENVETIVDRAEAAGHMPELREQFDIAFARALGKLPTALELAAPFLKRQGILMIPHGQTHGVEIERSERAMRELGVTLKDRTSYTLNSQVTFTALQFLKIESTPDIYPRKTGVPAKRPL
jgi:16S rRNA (guanine527-N7)-methyltransferase